jgi:hypothetical protein
MYYVHSTGPGPRESNPFDGESMIISRSTDEERKVLYDGLACETNDCRISFEETELTINITCASIPKKIIPHILYPVK